MKVVNKLFFQALLCLVALSACRQMSFYDHHAYVQTIDAKVEAASLISKATEPYGNYEEKVESLQRELVKLYEYEKYRDKNEMTVQMWEILINPEKNLLGGFLKRWKSEGTLNPVFVEEAKGRIDKAFDIILELETGKNRKNKTTEINSF